MVGDVTPGLVVLGSIRKQAKQARRSKPVSSTPSWPLHQLLLPDQVPVFLEFLSWLLSMTNSNVEVYTKQTLFSPTCFLAMVFCYRHSNNNQDR